MESTEAMQWIPPSVPADWIPENPADLTDAPVGQEDSKPVWDLYVPTAKGTEIVDNVDKLLFVLSIPLVWIGRPSLEDQSHDVQTQALRDFMESPAAVAMPSKLRKEVERRIRA